MNQDGLKHPCVSCSDPQAAIVIMHRKNGMRTTKLNGGAYKYCHDHWEWMMRLHPEGTTFEIELL